MRNILLTITDIFESYYHYVRGVIELAKLEAQLALKSLILIAICGFFILLLLVTCWGWLQVILLGAFLKLHLSLISAAACVGGINLLTILILFFVVKHLTKNLYFRATRRQITAVLKTRNADHE